MSEKKKTSVRDELEKATRASEPTQWLSIDSHWPKGPKGVEVAVNPTHSEAVKHARQSESKNIKVSKIGDKTYMWDGHHLNHEDAMEGLRAGGHLDSDDIPSDDAFDFKKGKLVTVNDDPHEGLSAEDWFPAKKHAGGETT